MNDALKNILYAEDEDDIREIAKIALEDLGGFNVKYCKNGKEVLDAIHHFQPDLILLDVMMPELDGPSTLLEVRKIPNFKLIPVVFMTARVQTNELAQYKLMGAIDVIEKPFDPMLLSNNLNEIWNKFRGIT